MEEYLLMICPSVIGGGTNLFPDKVSIAGLTLTDAKTFPLGVTAVHYIAGK